MLETVGVAIDATLLAEWETRVCRMRTALGWPDGALVARVHAGGASLALAAPLDQLLTATEVNEWAWLASLFARGKTEAKCVGMTDDLPEETLLPLGSTPVVGRGEGAGRRMREELHTVESAQGRSAFPSPQPLSRGERGFKQKLPFDPEALSFVRELRRSSADAEQLLWYLLRGRRLFDHKFRRQHAVGSYVLDFYCHELGLAIELDGGQHDEPRERARDARRDAFIEERGIRTLRFWNHDVLQRTDDVLAAIADVLEGRHMDSGFSPSPSGRGRSRLPAAEGLHTDVQADAEQGQRSVGVRERPSPCAQPPHAPGHPACWDEASALQTLHASARAEREPALLALVAAAEAQGLTALIDDDTLSLGIGSGARSWPRSALQTPDTVDWNALHDAPIALVTGSNGKTTTTRLVAAALRAHGREVAYTCTDGVYVGTVALAAGDYSGPAGARTALRAPGIDAVVLETARGGLLRRGLAARHADVAVVTNVSDDHFGEYGVHDLDDLAEVKLTVARALDADGMLVLNADDALLARRGGSAGEASRKPRLAWFALDADAPLLVAHRTGGGETCGVRDGHLVLHAQGVDHDLGEVAAMPLTFGGAARYNIANLAAAALAAHALGVALETLRALFARFGRERTDNPGRLQHWSVGGIDVFVDYAHNPDGLRGLLELATRERRGRLGLILGQAGNREDAEIRELATVAAAFAPDLVVLKDLPGFLRGRAEGEVPAILRAALLEHGVPADRMPLELDEFEAVRRALAWARAGDTLVLPVHGNAVKPRVAALLDGLQAGGWTAGVPLPPVITPAAT